MTRAETTKLLMVIKTLYYKAYEKVTTEDIERMILAWGAVLSDYTYEQCDKGLRIYLASDTKGFPPVPGQIIDCINRTIPRPESAMTAEEAWAKVRKAVGNSNYNAVEEFAELPPMIQRAVGNAESLRLMARIPSDDLETVNKSHFVRAYNALNARAEADAKLPPSLQQLTQTVSARIDGNTIKGIEEVRE